MEKSIDDREAKSGERMIEMAVCFLTTFYAIIADTGN